MGIFRLFTSPTGEFDLSSYLSFLMVALFAFAYHEYGHAIAADKLGDDTPRQYGRMTLNPFPHIDRVGFVLLAIFGFGWATTPINPSKLRGNQRFSHALVAIAGPAMNLGMAIIFALLFRLVQGPLFNVTPDWVFGFFNIGVWLNCLLCIFNLMPIPPLDGFTILMGVLPTPLADLLLPLRQYGFFILLALIFLLPRLQIDVFGSIFGAAFEMARFLVTFGSF